jgi:membrane protein
MDKVKTFLSLLKAAFDEFNEDKAPRLAAALSYYTIFSIAPLLIVVIAIAGLVWGHDAVQGRLNEQIQGLVGAQGGEMIQEMVQNAQRPNESFVATIIGLVTLLLGATGVFMQLKGALNTIWDVEPTKSGGILATIKAQLLSFTMVLGIGFLLLVALVISAVISALSTFINGLFGNTEFVLQVLNFVISFGFITLLFALIYKVLPDVDIEWRDVWIGAAFTSLLFTIGKTLIGLYLGNSGVTSTYGAAGSLVVILLWVFYSAQILFFGAEFTQVYARRYGSWVERAAKHARKAAPAEAARTPAGELPTQPQPVLAKSAIHPLPLMAIEPSPAETAEGQPAAEPTRFGVQQRLFAAASLVATLISFLAGLVFGARRGSAT